MRVQLLQYSPEWKDWKSNLRTLEKLFDPAADVVVFPEMGLTGYVVDPQDIADVAQPMNGAIVRMLHDLAQKCNKSICGSVVVAENGQFFNRLLFVKPSGELAWADKHHLFLGPEADNFTPGKDRVVVEVDGVKLLLLTCYDLRFPVWSRRVPGTEMDYDAIIYVASWAAQRRTAWQRLLPARAIENQCYVLGVNRLGADPNDEYAGDSAILDFLGNDLGLVAELDMKALKAFRQKFPAEKDGDKFTLL